ncbi:MAG: pyruvate kinase [Pseudomonadota bacterium]
MSRGSIFSHGTHADHAHMVEMVRAESLALGKPVALLQDLCGPKIRTGKIGPAVLNNGDTVDLIAGDTGDDHTDLDRLSPAQGRRARRRPHPALGWSGRAARAGDPWRSRGVSRRARRPDAPPAWA